MSLNAATIEILIAKGLTAADLLEVARATERKADPTNAERQARHRRKRNAVTVTETAPKEYISNPVPSEPEGSKVTKRSAEKPFEIEVPDWMPAEPWAAMVELRERLAKGRPKVDWSLAAARGLISTIDRLRGEGHCPTKLLEKAVISGWRTVYGSDDTMASTPVGRASNRPMNATELRRAIAFCEDNDNHERAAELKRQLAAINRESTGPPQAIGALVADVSRRFAQH